MTVADTVRRLGAVLSADESLADLAVRTRTRDSQSGDLAAAVADGTVIQSFLFRGPLHFVSPEDGGMYLVLRSAGTTLIKALAWQGDVRLGLHRAGLLTLQHLDGNPAWRGIPDLDEAGPCAVIAYFPNLRTSNNRPPALLARRRTERRPQTNQRLVRRPRR